MSALFGVVIVVIFFLYTLPLEASLYLYAFGIVILVIRHVGEFIRMRRSCRLLEKHLGMHEVYALDMPEDHEMTGRLYQELVRKLIDDKNQANSMHAGVMTEMKDYFTMWAHQIKTPISGMNLLLQVIKPENESEESKIKEIRQELFKTECYVEAVLQYLRLEDMSSDLRLERYSLEKIVKQTVKKYASQFIYRKIKVELGNLDTMVLTDEKWISFVIEQLISNAIKYTRAGGTVKLYLKETFNSNDRILVIEDTGIGIEEEDLPRIFEKGFTGYNGRMDKKSTGIGLYLCKKAIAKLSHRIWIESEFGKGTRVYVDMTVRDIRHE